jgi:hypothetical protein
MPLTGDALGYYVRVLMRELCGGGGGAVRDGGLFEKLSPWKEAFAPRLIREVAELGDDSGDHHREAAERRSAEQHRQ